MKISVLGAGTWGIALARMLCISGHEVTVWSALSNEIDHLQAAHTHPIFPDIKLPDELAYTADIEAACNGRKVIIIAVPSPFIRSTVKTASACLENGQILVSVAKGIEEATLFTMTEVIEDELGDIIDEKKLRVAALSGPTHAEEVIRSRPTTIISACQDEKTAEFIQEVFMNTCMRVYTNTDIKGVELCGALKNIIALASGILSGLDLGDNIKAALITRGLAEIKRLGVKLGCCEQTFYGLAGMGDLIVTCLSVHSRNYRAGILIGKGKTPQESAKEVGMVVEGINAIKPAMRLSKETGVELPIISAVNTVVYEGASPAEMLDQLMQRTKRSEI